MQIRFLNDAVAKAYARSNQIRKQTDSRAAETHYLQIRKYVDRYAGSSVFMVSAARKSYESGRMEWDKLFEISDGEIFIHDPRHDPQRLVQASDVQEIDDYTWLVAFPGLDGLPELDGLRELDGLSGIRIMVGGVDVRYDKKYRYLAKFPQVSRIWPRE